MFPTVDEQVQMFTKEEERIQQSIENEDLGKREDEINQIHVSNKNCQVCAKQVVNVRRLCRACSQFYLRSKKQGYKSFSPCRRNGFCGDEVITRCRKCRLSKCCMVMDRRFSSDTGFASSLILAAAPATTPVKDEEFPSAEDSNNISNPIEDDKELVTSAQYRTQMLMTNDLSDALSLGSSISIPCSPQTLAALFPIECIKFIEWATQVKNLCILAPKDQIVSFRANIFLYIVLGNVRRTLTQLSSSSDKIIFADGNYMSIDDGQCVQADSNFTPAYTAHVRNVRQKLMETLRAINPVKEDYEALSQLVFWNRSLGVMTGEKKAKIESVILTLKKDYSNLKRVDSQRLKSKWSMFEKLLPEFQNAARELFVIFSGIPGTANFPMIYKHIAQIFQF